MLLWITFLYRDREPAALGPITPVVLAILPTITDGDEHDNQQPRSTSDDAGYYLEIEEATCPTAASHDMSPANAYNSLDPSDVSRGHAARLPAVYDQMTVPKGDDTLTAGKRAKSMPMLPDVSSAK